MDVQIKKLLPTIFFIPFSGGTETRLKRALDFDDNLPDRKRVRFNSESDISKSKSNTNTPKETPNSQPSAGCQVDPKKAATTAQISDQKNLQSRLIAEAKSRKSSRQASGIKTSVVPSPKSMASGPTVTKTATLPSRLTSSVQSKTTASKSPTKNSETTVFTKPCSSSNSSASITSRPCEIRSTIAIHIPRPTKSSELRLASSARKLCTASRSGDFVAAKLSTTAPKSSTTYKQDKSRKSQSQISKQESEFIPKVLSSKPNSSASTESRSKHLTANKAAPSVPDVDKTSKMRCSSNAMVSTVKSSKNPSIQPKSSSDLSNNSTRTTAQRPKKRFAVPPSNTHKVTLAPRGKPNVQPNMTKPKRTYTTTKRASSTTRPKLAPSMTKPEVPSRTNRKISSFKKSLYKILLSNEYF